MIHANTALTEEENEWITQCAGRLRLIQADAAAMPAEKRREFLKEELGQSFQGIAPANRKRFLDALLARFPIAGHVPTSAAPQPAPAPPPPKPAAETVDQILERLIVAAAKLPDEKRAEMAKRLADAGMSWMNREAVLLEVPEDLQKRLGLPAGQQPHLARVVELAAFLIEAIALLDQAALKTMRELNPRSALLSRSEDFRKTSARFLTDVDGSLEKQWKAIRGLLGGLLAAVQGGGKDFSRQFGERLSPNSIEDVIMSEGGSIFGPNKKERCWERYKELFEDTARPELVERNIKECLAAFVERTVHGN